MNAASSRPLTPEYHPDLVVRCFIQELFRKAREIEQEALVMRHLVGAVLHRAFPGGVTDHPAVEEAGRKLVLGDFLVGDTIIQVIATPHLEIFEQSEANLRRGYQVLLLVADKYFCGTRQNVELLLPGRVMVNAVESFVCQNIESLAGFTKRRIAQGLREVLLLYNRRVETLEADPSLLIAIPPELEAVEG
jgi:hypothetical protein